MIKKVVNFVKTKIKLRTLIILIILLMFNSYAWFVYATKVSGRLTAYVSSWNVSFMVGEEEVSTNILFDVSRIYPGMEKYTKTVTAHNNGEVPAVISYEIKSLKVLDNVYTVNDKVTSDDILNMIENDFPFKIKITLDNPQMESEVGESKMEISVEWEYESGDDDRDTTYGEMAYEYYALHPDEESISLELEIKATQTK